MSLLLIETRNRDEINGTQYRRIRNYVYFNTGKLGQGNFSEVYLGMDEVYGKNVAIKIIKFNSLTNRIIQQLIRNQAMIIQCYDVFLSQGNCYIITQYCDGGDLQKLLDVRGYFSQKQLYPIIFGIYQGLTYLNQLGVVHRDLKPANILLTKNKQPKIADFGFAVRSKTTFKDISIGSPIYMSPEGMIYNEYGPKSQVWSFGVLVYQLLHGYAPLSHCKDEHSLRETIFVPPTFREGISYQLRKLIQFCLTIELKNRIQMKQIIYTPFMMRIHSELQRPIVSKDLYLMESPSEIKINSSQVFVREMVSYEQGLSLVQYCRLVHKTTQIFPSPILSQWLLNICQNLTHIRLIEGEQQNNKNLLQAIKDYYIKYKIQHRQYKLYVVSNDVVYECQRLKKENRNRRIILNSKQQLNENYLLVLIKQTQLLQRCIKNKDLGLYVMISQIPQFLQNVRMFRKRYKNIF